MKERRGVAQSLSLKGLTKTKRATLKMDQNNDKACVSTSNYESSQKKAGLMVRCGIQRVRFS